jgi:hypothetical protein
MTSVVFREQIQSPAGTLSRFVHPVNIDRSATTAYDGRTLKHLSTLKHPEAP